MLEYLSGIGRARKPSRQPSVVKKKTILKKAFAVLPTAMAIKLAKQVIAKNKNKPRSASQNTQNRALKSAVMKKRRAVFIKKGDPILLDEQQIEQAPVQEQEIEDGLIDQEVDNEIDQEERFEEDNAEMGIYFPDSLSGKADRKARKEAKLDKKKAKTEKIRAKAQLKKDKGEAKKTRAEKGGKSGKEMFSDVLDSAKKGVSLYKDIKGGGSGETESEPSGSGSGSSGMPMKKILIYGGIGLAVVLGGFMLMKRKK